MRSPVKILAALGLPLTLLACTAGGGDDLASTPLPTEGPAADYPMVIGPPFVIDGVQYTPADQLNYDQVGLATLDAAGVGAITGGSRTLPLPSYVEVTSLETGRTILVRVERRGPMSGNSLIGLSSGALSQLAASSGTPVRVRRVNPPEAERALLRRGEPAPGRMATPMALVEVLRRKLPGGGGNMVPLPKEEPLTTAPTPPVQPPAPEKPSPPTITRAVPAVMPKGSFGVQAGAFSVEANAKAVARKIDGSISKQNNLFVVRTGPFSTRNDATASLAKVKAAGYSSARIYRVE